MTDEKRLSGQIPLNDRFLEGLVYGDRHTQRPEHFPVCRRPFLPPSRILLLLWCQLVLCGEFVRAEFFPAVGYGLVGRQRGA